MDQVHTNPLTVELNSKTLSMEVKKWAPRNTRERGRASGVVDLDANDEHVTSARSKITQSPIVCHSQLLSGKPSTGKPYAQASNPAGDFVAGAWQLLSCTFPAFLPIGCTCWTAATAESPPGVACSPPARIGVVPLYLWQSKAQEAPHIFIEFDGNRSDIPPEPILEWDFSVARFLWLILSSYSKSYS